MSCTLAITITINKGTYEKSQLNSTIHNMRDTHYVLLGKQFPLRCHLLYFGVAKYHVMCVAHIMNLCLYNARFFPRNWICQSRDYFYISQLLLTINK